MSWFGLGCVLVVSWWHVCGIGIMVVSRWWSDGVSVCLGWVSVVWLCLGRILVVSGLCLGGVSVVSWWYLGAILAVSW